MTAVELGLIVGTLLAATAGFIYFVLKLNKLEGAKAENDDVVDGVNDAAQRVFNEEFREELKNRGRLHFEKIIGENAMFLQQDLRLTTSELNDFMKGEISKKLQTGFEGYQQSIDDARKMAVSSIAKTQEVIEQQRAELGQQVTKELEAEKVRALKRFHDNMGDIVAHYLKEAIGNQIDLDAQMDFIVAELEKNKEDIVKDVQNGA